MFIRDAMSCWRNTGLQEQFRISREGRLEKRSCVRVDFVSSQRAATAVLTAVMDNLIGKPRCHRHIRPTYSSTDGARYKWFFYSHPNNLQCRSRSTVCGEDDVCLVCNAVKWIKSQKAAADTRLVCRIVLH